MANKVEVIICGEVITLRSNEEEAHLQRIARYIDRKLTDLTAANANASFNERIRTLLIALNVADEYFKASDALARVNVEQEKYMNEIALMQEENELLQEKFYELQAELANTRAELETFISEFDTTQQNDSAKLLSLPSTKKRKATVR